MKKAILQRLMRAVVGGDEEDAREAAAEALKAGIDPIEAINEGSAKGMRIVGERFGRLEVFLPDLILAADAMKAAIEVLEPKIVDRRAEIRRGTVVIGTVKGDVHDIGKNIVALLLTAAGFDVDDLGIDVPAKEYVKRAEEVGANIVAASGLLSTSMPYMKEIIELLRDMGLRDKYKVMVGGGTVTAEWAENIGADGYGKDAVEAVSVALQLLKGKGAD